jgi:hypothetical protein
MEGVASQFWPTREFSVSNRFLLWVGIAGFLVGLFSFVYYVVINGGPVRLLTVRPRTAFQTVPQTARYRLIGLAGTTGGFVTVFCAYWGEIKSETLRSFDRILITLVSGINIAVSISTRTRWVVLLPLAYLGIYFYTAERISNRQVTILGLSIIGFGAMFSFVELTLIGSGSMNLLIRGFIHTPRFRVFMITINEIPQSYPFQGGATIIRNLGLLIGINLSGPKYGDVLDIIVFGTNRKFITLAGLHFSELYLNFGYIGIPIGGASFGIALKIVSNFRSESTSYITHGLYPVILLGAALLVPTHVAYVLKIVYFRMLLPPLAAVLFVKYVTLPTGIIPRINKAIPNARLTRTVKKIISAWSNALFTTELEKAISNSRSAEIVRTFISVSSKARFETICRPLNNYVRKSRLYRWITKPGDTDLVYINYIAKLNFISPYLVKKWEVIDKAWGNSVIKRILSREK